jgi:MOSC domain-containing protein YiiM
MPDDPLIDSESMGDPARFRSLAELEEMLEALPDAPKDQGRVAMLVRKNQGGQREILERVVLSSEEGVPGDAWGRREHPNEDAQLTVMQRDVAELLANGQPLVLFGDNLILELDLSARNLPPGSRVRVGRALLQVTPLPHNGCAKFRGRFGDNALRFVSKPELRYRNLRGIYMHVLQKGEVKPGDAVEIVYRAPAPEVQR